MQKISREEAIQLGLKRFFTGVPCINGHICERIVKKHGSACVECHRLARKARDPEWVRLRKAFFQQERRARDPERVRQQWREWSARQKATRRAAAENGNGPISAN
jgi:hypothetical protein